MCKKIAFLVDREKTILDIREKTLTFNNKPRCGQTIEKYLHGKSDKNTFDYLIKKITQEKKPYRLIPLFFNIEGRKYYSELDMTFTDEGILCSFNLKDENLKFENIRNLEQFSAGTAHKINNYLTPISGSYQILKLNLSDKSQTPEDLQNSIDKYLEILNTSIVKMTKLTKDLTKFSYELHSPKRIPSDMTDILKEYLPELQKSCKKKGISLEFSIKLAKNEYLIDPQAVRSVLARIFDNAMDYLKEGEAIFLSTEETLSHIDIVITDNGCGIENDLLKRATDPFASSKKSGDGLGLGLTSSEQIMKINSGRMEIVMLEPRGTEIRLSWDKISM